MSEGKPFIKSGQLFDCQNPFDDLPNKDILFAEAMNEALHWHLSHCSDYKAFMAENGLVDDKELYLLEQIPPILIDVLNNYKLTSVPDKQIKYSVLTENNSNSTDRKLILDARSYKRLLRIWENIFNYFGFVEHNQKVNYLCLTYDSKYENVLNGNFYYNILTALTAHRSVYYAIRFDKNKIEFKFDLEASAKKIIDFSCHSEPVRIIGSYFYLNKICEWFEKNKIELKLNKKSCIFIFNDPEFIITNTSIKKRLESIFDIKEEKIRNILVFPNQGIPYIECKNGNYHLPIYANAAALEPESLLPVSDGEKGLLCLMTPYLTGYPANSILTDYKVVMDNCDCGINSKTFKMLNSGI